MRSGAQQAEDGRITFVFFQITIQVRMSSRYISRRYGGDSASSELKHRSASMTRGDSRARSQSREPGHYSRCRSSSPARASGLTQYSSNLQYYRPDAASEVGDYHSIDL